MFVESEEQSLLRHAVDAFFRSKANADARGWSPEEWRALALELGILAAPFPEDMGGAGGSLRDAMIIMELLGEHLLVRPYLECVIMAGRAIAASAHPRRRALIEAIGSGELLIVPAVASGIDDALVVEPDGQGGFVLSGSRTVVMAAPWATHFLVSAQLAGQGTMLVLIPADAPGLNQRSARAIDSFACADLAFMGVAVSAEDVIAGASEGAAALAQMQAEATVAACCEGIGVLRSMIDQTVDYAKQRKQFDQSLSSFQVIQHRLVDMRIAAEHATSLARSAALVVENTMQDKAFFVAAAKHAMNLALDSVGRSAVQIYGAVGLMEETPISWYFKRSVVLKIQFGTSAHHLDTLGERAGATVPLGEDGTDVVADLFGVDADPEIRAFRAEVREFLADALTPELRQRAAWETGAFARPDVSVPWQKALAAKGWAAPSWPVEYGGPGWSARKRQVFEQEMARAGAPRLPAMGLQMVAPVIMQFGTPEQKARFLPRILNAEEQWCQGYSEPGAGSDLAALQLQAVNTGDEYVINGSKIWTTFAQYADWIFVLARTKQCDRKQDGISFILIPMTAPGLTVRPLISMSGEHEVNQVFFDDVRVPVSNVVGAENEGWKVAKYLLEFERGVGHQVPALVQELARAREIAQSQPGKGNASLWDEQQFRRRFADLEARTLAIRMTEERMVYALPAGSSVGDATAAIMKLAWSEMGQEVDELIVDALGAYATIDQEPAFKSRDPGDVFGPACARTPIRRYLDNRVLTVAGGSSEVLRTILARQLLK